MTVVRDSKSKATRQIGNVKLKKKEKIYVTILLSDNNK